MKSHKNAKLGLLQKLNTLGKIGLQMGFWHTQKPPARKSLGHKKEKAFLAFRFSAGRASNGPPLGKMSILDI